MSPYSLINGRLSRLATPWKSPMVQWRSGSRGLVTSLSSARGPKSVLIFSHTSSSSSEKRLPLTLLEIEKMRILLQNGLQIWEVALCIGRSESFVRRPIQDNDELASLLSESKRGKWSSAEKSVLLGHLAQQRAPNKNKIARQMGRTADSVARQMKKLIKPREYPVPLFSSSEYLARLRGTPIIYYDKVELSKSTRAILEVRLDSILVGLTMAHKTKQWDHVLMATPRAEWVGRILTLIPTTVGRILAAPSPPTISELNALEWEDMTKMGVYIWILTRKFHNPFYPEHDVYIGSATNHDLKPSRWIYQHRQGKKGGFSISRHRFHQRLRKTGHFAALPSMDVTSSEPKEVVKARQLLVLAEATLAISLSALTHGSLVAEEEYRGLRGLCPYPEKVPYCGLCSHNPLMLDIPYPPGYTQL
ncbi:hypothetical protein EV127DRAFT_375530 [Xylaria flabelliformis]|nr:hypothetical protein EV127DRAFT_375530 [Xylaria flabelliformis]